MDVLDGGEDCTATEDVMSAAVVEEGHAQAHVQTPEAAHQQQAKSSLRSETAAQVLPAKRARERHGRQCGLHLDEVALPDCRETRKRQAMVGIAAEDGKLMAVVKKMRSTRAAAPRDKLSPIDMFLRMSGKEVPSAGEEVFTGRQTRQPREGRHPQHESNDEAEQVVKDPITDIDAALTANVIPSLHTHHYLVSLRGLQNHRVMSHLTSRCNVSLIETTGTQDDWDWDLILDATSAVILFRLSLLPAAMRVESHASGAKSAANGREGDLNLKQMLQSERFDAFLVLLEVYSSSGRQVEQTRPLILAQKALQEFISLDLGSSKSVAIDMVRTPLEAAVRIRRWGEQLRESAVREEQSLLQQGAPANGLALTSAKVWEGRESWLQRAGEEQGEAERGRLQALGLNVL